MSKATRWDIQGDYRLIEHPRGDWVSVSEYEMDLAKAEQEGRDSVFRIFNSDHKKHSITNERHVLFCAECYAILNIYKQGQWDEREKHHTHYCCAVCDYHVMPHRRCILR